MPEVSFFYETRDFIVAYRRAAHLAWGSRRLWIFIVFSDIVLIGVFTFFAAPQNRGHTVAAIALALVLVSIPATWLYQRVSASINGRCALKIHPVFREKFTYEIHPDCIIQRNKYGSTIVRWSELQAFSEGHNMWLLYPDFLPRRFCMLPKRHPTPEFVKALRYNLKAADVHGR